MDWKKFALSEWNHELPYEITNGIEANNTAKPLLLPILFKKSFIMQNKVRNDKFVWNECKFGFSSTLKMVE